MIHRLFNTKNESQNANSLKRFFCTIINRNIYHRWEEKSYVLITFALTLDGYTSI